MRIQPSILSESDAIFQLLTACAKEMRDRGILQWDESYPDKALVSKDIQDNSMHSVYLNKELIAVLVMDEIQSPQYASLKWNYLKGSILVVHRLATHPRLQKQGIGKKLMLFAEKYAQENDYAAIRLDAFKGNEPLQKFYQNLGYEQVGEIPLEYTAGPFVCYEKRIS